MSWYVSRWVGALITVIFCIVFGTPFAFFINFLSSPISVIFMMSIGFIIGFILITPYILDGKVLFGIFKIKELEK